MSCVNKEQLQELEDIDLAFFFFFIISKRLFH